MAESDHEPCLAQKTLVRVSLLIEGSRIRPKDRTQRACDRSERYLALPAAHRAIRTRSASPIFCGRLCRTRDPVNACKSRVFAAFYGVALHSPHCGIVLRMPISACQVFRDQHLREQPRRRDLLVDDVGRHWRLEHPLAGTTDPLTADVSLDLP